MSVTAPEQCPPLVLGKCGLHRVPAAAGESSPFSPSGEGQRTGSADRARHGEGRAEQQELSPRGASSKDRADDEDPGEQQATRGTPSREARKRRAVEPTTALDAYESPGEYEAGKEAERGEREVGMETGYPRQQEPRTEP